MAGTTESEVAQAVDEAVAALTALTSAEPTRAYAEALALPRTDGPAALLAAVETLRGELQTVDRVLADLHARASRAEEEQATAEPLGSTWWQRRRRELNRLSGAEHERLWLRTWVKAFAAERFDLCAKVLAIKPPDGGRYEFADRLGTVATAAASGDLWPAARALHALFEPPTRDSLEATTVVRLAVLLTRIHLYQTRDVEAAEAAAQLLPTDAADPQLPKAVLAAAASLPGELALARGEFPDAGKTFQDLVAAMPALPDGYIGLGLVAEAENAWYQADDNYDLAVTVGGRAVAEPVLRRPIPANLLWRCARQLREEDPAWAFHLLERALQDGIKGEGSHPERSALRDRARLLKDLGRDAEAAATQHRAGEMFAAAGENQRAIACFEAAHKLDSSVAKYWWDHAEALRVSGIHPYGGADGDVMKEAWLTVNEGFQWSGTADVAPWSLVTAALIAEQLPDPPTSPLILAERSLLLDDRYARGYAYVATLLRDAGYPADALAAAGQAYHADAADGFVVDAFARALLDHGRDAQALTVIEKHELLRPGTPDLLYAHVVAELLRGRPAAAAVVARQGSGVKPNMYDTLLGTAYLICGDEERARRRFDQVWDRRASMNSQYFPAYAAWLGGRTEQAVEAYEGMGRTITDNTFPRDMALALLTRGGPADLARARDLLAGAVAAERIVLDLRYLTAVEFPLLLRLVGDAPHAARVARIVADTETAAHGRITALLDARREPDDDAAQLATARVRIRDGELGDAIRIYAGLAERGVAPEAPLRIARAAGEVIKNGDQVLRKEGLPAARHVWEDLQATAAPFLADQPESGALQARLALATQEQAGPDAAAPLLAALLTRPDGPRVLTGALTLFARDIPTFWAHRDALLSRREDDDLPAPARQSLGEIAGSLDLSRVARLRRRDVGSAAVFPLLTQVEVRLGEDFRGRADDLAPRLDEVRHRIAAETGVLVPAVRTTVGLPRDPGSVEFCVVEQVVGRARPEPRERSGAPFADWVAGRLETSLRPSLARVFGVDDLLLWLDGWESAIGERYAGLRADARLRLRLVRLLRLLLREGVPITDRQLIVTAFQQIEADGPADPLIALRSVRRRLGRAALETGPATAVTVSLDPALRERIAAGLNPRDPSVWQLRRADAEALVADLASWHDARRAEADGPVRVLVDDGVLRPHVWRLMAGTRREVTVLAGDE